MVSNAQLLISVYRGIDHNNFNCFFLWSVIYIRVKMRMMNVLMHMQTVCPVELGHEKIF